MGEATYGVASPEQVAGMTGLELMRGVIEGRVPQAPIGLTLGFRLLEASEGFCLFEGEPDASLRNPHGTVHGGWALTLIDSAAGCAAHTLLPKGGAYTTVETHANFTRPILPDAGPVRCEGRVVNPGRTLIVAEARVLDSTGRLLAHGGSTLMVLASRQA